MDKTANWANLSWEEKREERFKRWFTPPNVKYTSPEAEQLHKERATRFIKAIKMEEPDRVPVMLPIGNLPVYYGGTDLHTVMYDVHELRRVWMKFMDDFGDMDYFRGPTMVTSGKVSDAIDLRSSVWPGHGLPVDASMIQFVENEYMKADEYDRWLADPTEYNVKYLLPRTAGLFSTFPKFSAMRNFQAVNWVSALADPELRNTFQKLIDIAAEFQQWQAVVQELSSLATARGYISFQTAGPLFSAPFDHFADHLRGTRGIANDMYRQPQKLHQAMERWLNITIELSIKNYPMTNCPLVMMPLHKGDDTFMSAKQFETFYWPYLRGIFLALIEEGLVPMPFAEGRYTTRLKTIADTPKSSVVWYFDQTDMAEAKKTVGKVSCLVGNVPTSVIMTNTPAQVKEHCRKLIEVCAPGGGYILAGGASVDKGSLENLKAMMDAANEYGTYRK